MRKPSWTLSQALHAELQTITFGLSTGLECFALLRFASLCAVDKASPSASASAWLKASVA